MWIDRSLKGKTPFKRGTDGAIVDRRVAWVVKMNFLLTSAPSEATAFRILL